jgi:hypothetical protein
MAREKEMGRGLKRGRWRRLKEWKKKDKGMFIKMKDRYRQNGPYLQRNEPVQSSRIFSAF